MSHALSLAFRKVTANGGSVRFSYYLPHFAKGIKRGEQEGGKINVGLNCNIKSTSRSIQQEVLLTYECCSGLGTGIRTAKYQGFGERRVSASGPEILAIVKWCPAPSGPGE